MKRSFHFIFLLVAFATCLSSHGQTTIKPIVATELVCDHLRMENDGVKAYFLATGNVVLTGTNMEIICDKLEINVSRNGENPKASIGEFGAIENMVATGNVKITQAERIATAGLVIVEPDKEQIILRDNPVVMQTGTSLSGLEIIIQRGKGIVIVPGSKENRVRFVGPSIKDLGFETDKKIEKTETETEESDPENTEPVEAEVTENLEQENASQNKKSKREKSK